MIGSVLERIYYAFSIYSVQRIIKFHRKVCHLRKFSHIMTTFSIIYILILVKRKISQLNPIYCQNNDKFYNYILLKFYAGYYFNARGDSEKNNEEGL